MPDERKAVTAYAKHLQEEVFPDLRVAVLHGKMKPKEKDAVMSAFAAGESDILVSTTVIEVGVDVPNANTMVVENAERFGLRIPYMTMNKRDYLALIDHLAGLYQVEMDRELLHARAMEGEIRHAGRTPRVARQFIASLTG